MLTRPITYKDFDDNEVTEQFHFHLSEADLIKFELLAGEGLHERIATMIERKEGAKVLELFESLIRLSVGRKEGKHFKKSEEITSDLMDTGAYSVLFRELVTDGDSAARFIQGVMPKGLAEKAGLVAPVEEIATPSVVQAARPETVIDLPPEAVPSDTLVTADQTTDQPQDLRPQYQRENRKATDAELQGMTREEMLAAFQWRESNGF